MNNSDFDKVVHYLPYNPRIHTSFLNKESFLGYGFRRHEQSLHSFILLSRNKFIDRPKLVLYSLDHYKDVSSKHMIELKLRPEDRKSLSDYANIQLSLHEVPFGVVRSCLKHHVDIFRLIKKNFAIDKDQLNEKSSSTKKDN